MKRNRKYVVYINRDWFNAICIERHCYDMAEQQHLRERLYKNAQDFLLSKGELNTIFCETFFGSDGKMHKAIEFKIIEGRHSGKPLKRLKNKRR